MGFGEEFNRNFAPAFDAGFRESVKIFARKREQEQSAKAFEAIKPQMADNDAQVKVAAQAVQDAVREAERLGKEVPPDVMRSLQVGLMQAKNDATTSNLKLMSQWAATGGPAAQEAAARGISALIGAQGNDLKAMQQRLTIESQDADRDRRDSEFGLAQRGQAERERHNLAMEGNQAASAATTAANTEAVNRRFEQEQEMQAQRLRDRIWEAAVTETSLETDDQLASLAASAAIANKRVNPATGVPWTEQTRGDFIDSFKGDARMMDQARKERAQNAYETRLRKVGVAPAEVDVNVMPQRPRPAATPAATQEDNAVQTDEHVQALTQALATATTDEEKQKLQTQIAKREAFVKKEFKQQEKVRAKTEKRERDKAALKAHQATDPEEIKARQMGNMFLQGM